ncbi:MAG: PIN domain protein, partial [Planctomycetota bacterium]
MAARGKLLRVYVDTSVIGGCLDEEFRVASGRLIERSRAGDAVLVISDTTLAELAGAPPKVAGVIEDLPKECLELIHQDEESEALAEEYIRQKVVSRRMLADAQHIAVATVARVDVLVSWNFRHIVNLDRIHGYNAVNLRSGYPMLEIRSPLE